MRWCCDESFAVVELGERRCWGWGTVWSEEAEGESLSYGGRDRREPKKDPMREWVRWSNGRLELSFFGL